MRNNTPITYTDEEILSLNRVTTEVAAKYLGTNAPMLRHQIEYGQVPFGTCRKESGKRTFYINPQILVDYKNGRASDGEMYKALAKKVDVLNENVAELTKMVSELVKAKQS